MARNDLIDRYVAAVRHRLGWHRDVDDIADELDDHLRSAAGSLVEQGAEPSSAQQEVLDRFGDPAQVSMSFVATGSSGPALPTEFTRSAGMFGIISAAGWCAVALASNASNLAERVTGSWEGVPQALFMLAAGILLATAATQVVLLLGVDRRHGGLGVSGLAGVAAACLGTAACLLAWFLPLWAALLGLGWLLVAVPALRRDVLPRAALVAGAAAWPLGVGAMIGLSALGVGPVDAYGDRPLAHAIGLTLGAVLSAVALALLGRRLAREVPAEVALEARVA